MKILDKLGPNACPALRFVRPSVVSGAAVAGETSQQPLRSSAANNQRRKSMLRAASVVGVLAAAWGIRFVLGMRTQLDADEATLGLAALHITQGHLVLTEPNDHYLGALEAYLLAPFVAIMGTTLAAIRAATATVGAAFVLASYALGQTIFHVHRRALILAGVSSVFPLFAVFWSTKARGGYAEALPLEAAAYTDSRQSGPAGPRL